MDTSVRYEEARKWVDSLEHKWRLQILSKRFRVDSATGKQVETPTRIRRFVEGIPWALVNDSIGYLLSTAPYTGILYNGVELEGEYRPTITTWKRDDNDSVVDRKSDNYNDGTYTLIQDLVPVGTHDVLSGVPTSSSCTEEALTEWHWDEADVDSLPVTSEQGVSYAIQAVSRNEDGTFDYALVKRTAKTRPSGSNVRTDDAVSRVVESVWDNVYGSPETGFVDENGAPLDIPKASADGNTKVERQVRMNDDCTYRVEVVSTTTKPVVGAKTSSEKDQFEDKKSSTSFGASSPLPPAPEPANGVVKRHESTLNPDGSYTNTESSQSEKPVTSSTVEVSVGRRGKRVTVTDRNQDAPADTSSVDVGGSVRVEKTPGKKYNNTVSGWVRSGLMKVANVCKIDLFSHRHSDTKAGLSAIPDDDVRGGGEGGKTVTRTTQMDEEGSITQTDETEVEINVKAARESWVAGLFGLRHRIEERSASKPLPAPKSGDVGHSVTNEKTPGGLWNTTDESLDRTAGPVQTGAECRRTVFEETDVRITRKPNLEIPGHVDPASGGVSKQVTGSMNEDGSVTVRETTVKESKVSRAEVSVRKTAKATITQVTDRNTDEVIDPSKVGVGETQSQTVTDGGLRNVTKTSVVVNPVADRGHGESDAFVDETDDVTVKKGTRPDNCEVSSGSGGKYKQKDSALDDNGVVTTVEREFVEKKTELEVTSVDGPMSSSSSSTSRKDSKESASASGNSIVTVRAKKTRGGLWDVYREVETPKTGIDSIWRLGPAGEESSSPLAIYTVGFFNLDKSKAEGVYKEVSNKLSGWFKSKHGSSAATMTYPDSARVYPTVSMNRFGLFDGTITARAEWPTKNFSVDPDAQEYSFEYGSADKSSSIAFKMIWFSYKSGSAVGGYVRDISNYVRGLATERRGASEMMKTPPNSISITPSVSFDEYGNAHGHIFGRVEWPTENFTANTSFDSWVVGVGGEGDDTLPWVFKTWAFVFASKDDLKAKVFGEVTSFVNTYYKKKRGTGDVKTVPDSVTMSPSISMDTWGRLSGQVTVRIGWPIDNFLDTASGMFEAYNIGRTDISLPFAATEWVFWGKGASDVERCITQNVVPFVTGLLGSKRGTVAQTGPSSFSISPSVSVDKNGLLSGRAIGRVDWDPANFIDSEVNNISGGTAERISNHDIGYLFSILLFNNVPASRMSKYYTQIATETNWAFGQSSDPNNTSYHNSLSMNINKNGTIDGRYIIYAVDKTL